MFVFFLRESLYVARRMELGQASVVRFCLWMFPICWIPVVLSAQELWPCNYAVSTFVLEEAVMKDQVIMEFNPCCSLQKVSQYSIHQFQFLYFVQQ